MTIFRKTVAAMALFATIGSASGAQAQDCYSLRSERSFADERGSYLAGQNPGTALVAAGCMVAAADEYDRTGYARDAAGTFAVCGALGCAFTDDYSICLTKGSEIIWLAFRVIAAEDRMRRIGCRW